MTRKILIITSSLFLSAQVYADKKIIDLSTKGEIPNRTETPITPPKVNYDDETNVLEMTSDSKESFIVTITDEEGNEVCRYDVAPGTTTLPLPTLDEGSHTIGVTSGSTAFEGNLDVK